MESSENDPFRTLFGIKRTRFLKELRKIQTVDLLANSRKNFAFSKNNINQQKFSEQSKEEVTQNKEFIIESLTKFENPLSLESYLNRNISHLNTNEDLLKKFIANFDCLNNIDFSYDDVSIIKKNLWILDWLIRNISLSDESLEKIEEFIMNILIKRISEDFDEMVVPYSYIN